MTTTTDALRTRVQSALADPACARLREWAAIGPVQLAAVETLADLVAQQASVPSAEPASKWCAIHQHFKPCGHTRETAQPPAALHTAIRLVLEATPEQLPLALDALRDMTPNV